MKKIIYIIVFIISVSSLKAWPPTIDTTLLVVDPLKIAEYDQIMDGLNKSKIINIFYNEFYKKNYDSMLPDSLKQDSIDYMAAVHKFYDADIDIVFYLMQFLDDSSKCNWVRTRDKMRATYLLVDELISRKYIAALILIECYLRFEGEYWISIPRCPTYIAMDPSQPLVLFDKNYLKKWKYFYRKNKKGLNKTIRYDYKYNLRPWYKVYGDSIYYHKYAK